MIGIQPRSSESVFKQQEKRDKAQRYPCEAQLFSSVQMYMHRDYEINHVQVMTGESIYTIRIKPISPQISSIPLYMTHGFGGTSLLYYDLTAMLRYHSEIILFDLRGHGLSDKVNVEISNTQAIIDYFLEGIEKVRQYYQHTKINLMAHSFGAYLCMLYGSAYTPFVEKLIMFSPIGITPKQQDYKNKITNCKDLWQYLMSHIGWKCNITYKNQLDYLVCCCKKAVLRRVFKKQGNPEQRVEAFSNIILRLLMQPLGSERLFYKIFQPRVLPIYNLEQHFRENAPHCRIKMIYGENDWVDRTGAKQLTMKYPKVCSYGQIAGADHSMFFYWREGIQQELIDLIIG